MRNREVVARILKVDKATHDGELAAFAAFAQVRRTHANSDQLFECSV